jgi:hypothetical protein
LNGAVGNADSSLPWRLQLLRLRWSRSVFAKAWTCKFRMVGGRSLGTRLAARTLREHIAFWPSATSGDVRYSAAVGGQAACPTLAPDL